MYCFEFFRTFIHLTFLFVNVLSSRIRRITFLEEALEWNTHYRTSFPFSSMIHPQIIAGISGGRRSLRGLLSPFHTLSHQTGRCSLREEGFHTLSSSYRLLSPHLQYTFTTISLSLPLYQSCLFFLNFMENILSIYLFSVCSFYTRTTFIREKLILEQGRKEKKN